MRDEQAEVDKVIALGFVDPAVELGIAEPDSWTPIKLGPYLRGEVERVTPTVGLRRSDGLHLLYPGKEHSVIGEMEAGKSWFSLACCAAELAAGHRVVYVHFEESDPMDSVERLLALGVSPDRIERLFAFVGPCRPVDPETMAALLTPAPTLVVLDGVNEGMSLHRHGIRDEDGAAEFRRLLVKPCIRVGAATLSADHVVKDPERRGRGPLGSIHKANALNGTLILLENSDPFGRGQKGRSRVFVTKDRPGFLRGNGKPTKTPGKTYMGELVVDDTRARFSYLDLAFWAPKPDIASTPEVDPEEGSANVYGDDDAAVLTAVKDLVESGEVANVSKVRARAGLKSERASAALDRLLNNKALTVQMGRRNSREFGIPKPSSRSQDQAVLTGSEVA